MRDASVYEWQCPAVWLAPDAEMPGADRVGPDVTEEAAMLCPLEPEPAGVGTTDGRGRKTGRGRTDAAGANTHTDTHTHIHTLFTHIFTHTGSTCFPTAF